ncbi:bifunctional 5,10-methylenetetrahydrofolate dehydrogenase/5,10-methenyltetrahydrofolate cyclohydrolase [Bradyrhizobium zhanjiangense]|uniref:bifunctional 5,10-methylenetetrahydrofolate dehydrogenase/5,10-methenyltetrahydrofolate cyclohydrolase n=1 Tax=Bradyrhizobium zhanjiangense TaxID=1325107 RepID=UPI003B8341E1
MTAINIDGKAIAEQERLITAAGIAELQRRRGRVPGLAVVLVGNDPASEVYVASKARQTIATGMRSFEHRLPAETSQEALLCLIHRLNTDDEVDGHPGPAAITVLPSHIDTDTVIRSVVPAKDVDGFHPENAGRLMRGLTSLVPCTPLGCMLLRSVQTKLVGQHAVVVGRSNIVGKPIAQLLLQGDCTVTMTHSRSHDLP